METEKYFQDFFEQFNYPQEARSSLLSALQKVKNIAVEEFQKLVDSYDKRWVLDVFLDAEEKMYGISQKAGIHEFEGRFLLYLHFAPKLLTYYKESGYSEEMWKSAMNDLKYKMVKCKLMHNVWGSFLRGWFAGFFQMKRFAFGKLEFELKELHRTYEKNGISLIPESVGVYIHIPRTGEPLTKEDQDIAFAQAKAFFQPYFGRDKKIPFFTGSWLLFAKNKEYLKPNSNLMRFIERFEILDTFEYADYTQTWRIFNKPFTKWEDMPQDTSLQKAYVEMIKKGEKTGGAYGIFFL